MKILFYTDVHFCKTSSIITGRGERFSIRLDNLIKSLNWVEEIGYNVDQIICLGDFFDRPNLNDEELTALNQIKWCTDTRHIFLVGNHEIMGQSLDFSSTQALTSVKNSLIEDQVSVYDYDDFQIMFLPYIIEENRKPIDEYQVYKDHRDLSKKLIICSHNDIKGIQYGAFESKEGFDLGDIESHCNFFINGHLHNGSWLNSKKTILNLGNLTGQNFSEDAFIYKHQAMILDTDSLKVEFLENPYAFNFYKIQVDNDLDLDKLDKIKNNAVLSLKVKDSLTDDVKSKLETLSNNIIQYKLSIYSDTSKVSNNQGTDVLVGIDNHLDQFKKFIMMRDDEEFMDKSLVESELMEVCK